MIYYPLLLLLGTLVADATTVNETTKSCPSPFVVVGVHCVHLDLTVSGTWEEMRQFCQELASDLAVLSDAQFYVDSQQYIRAIGTPAENANIWIGASDEELEGMWLWIDGTPVLMGTPYWVSYGCGEDQGPANRRSNNCALLNGSCHHYVVDASCGYNDGHPFCLL